MYQEKLSIIIPTKNRQKYAYSCITSLLKNPAKDYEIVVQDNSDDDSLRGMLEEYFSDKLVYSYEPTVLSFCDNFERAVKLSSGDYLIIIGDDDGVNEDILEVVRFARAKNLDAVSYSMNVSYLWPSAFDSDKENGTLTVRDTIAYVKRISCKKSVKKMFRKGNFNYQDYPFPKIYHGIVKRSLLDEVAKNTGRYFGGLTPDIYSAVALSALVDKMVYVNYPLSYHGICPKSGSADSVTGRHRGELKDAPHFRGTKDYQWSSAVPAVYSVGTIWADTAMKAVADSKLTAKLHLFNYTAYLIRENKALKSRFIDFYVAEKKKNRALATLFLNIKILGIKLKAFIARGSIFLARKLMGRHVYRDVATVGEAMEIVEAHNEKKKTLRKIQKKLDKLGV